MLGYHAVTLTFYFGEGEGEKACFNSTLVTALRICEHYDQTTDAVKVPCDSGGLEDRQVTSWWN